MMRGFVFAIALMVGCAHGGVPQASTPNDAVKVSLPSKHYFLPNGLEVVLAPDHHLPFVAIRLRYHVGSKDDPPGRSGMAHLVEHLTFGMGSHDKADDLTYARIGIVESNAETWLDWTDYHAYLPKTQLEAALWIESQRMTFVAPTIDVNLLNRELGVVAAERSEHYGNVPYGAQAWIVLDALFPNGHPYRRSTIGNMTELSGTRVDEVQSFLKMHYVPDNATLVLVGDFESSQAATLLEKYFANIPPGGNRAQPRVIPTPDRPAHALVKSEANVPFPVLITAWLGPPPGSPWYQESRFALEPVTGVVRHRTMKLQNTARSAHWYAWGGRLGSIYEVVITGERGAAMNDLIADVKYAMWDATRFRSRYIDTLKSHAIAEIILGLEDLPSRAEHTLDGLDRFGTPDYAQHEIDNLVEVTPVGVQAAVAELLTEDRASFIWIEPNAGTPPAGRIIQ
jgi:predicted Zn-dependent peptidase